MADWTYAATDLISGKLLAESLPLNVQTFNSQLNGSGNLSASLNLNAIYEVNTPFVAALMCRRAVLWAIADDWPVWCGPVLDWPDTSRSQGTLTISAQTMDSMFSHRLITDTLEYPAVDLFSVFVDLVTYGQTKNSPYIETGVSPAATRNPAYLAAVAKYGPIARLVVPDPGLSGTAWTASYTYSDLTQVSSAWSDMCQSGNLEYAFVPGLDDDGELACFVTLGYTALGRPVAETGVTLSMPGNVLDYGWTVTGSQSSNVVWATAPPNGSELQWQSQFPHGADLSDLAAGYPLMESTVSWQGSNVTAQSQVDGYADGQVALTTAGMTAPVLTVGGGSSPRIQDLQLGDGVQLALTSPLHAPDPLTGAPGVQQEVRITAITAYPPGPQQAESYQLTTSGVVVA